MDKKPSKQSVESWAVLFRAYRVLRNETEKELKKAQLPPLAWYDVLWEVYKCPEKKIRQNELGDRVLLNKHNLSRLLDRLVGQKLIKKSPSPDDKRGYNIELTLAGRKILNDMWEVYGTTIHNCFSRHYTQKEMSRIHQLISRLI